MFRLTEEELASFKVKGASKNYKNNKYKAKQCEADGYKFPSVLERDHYLVKKAEVKAGDSLFFLRQVPIYLKGAIIRVDFYTMYKNNEFIFEDDKGLMTPAWKAKQRMVESRYPFKIFIRDRKYVDERMRHYGIK